MVDRPVRVLVVDDAVDMRALLKASLEIDGRFRVVAEAANGKEAIDAVATMPVDLVVLDREMPVMDGLTALPVIHERAPGVAVVLYTAVSDRGTRQAAVAAGAVEVVEKASAAGLVLVERLADTLVSLWGDDDADLHVAVGPVPSATALLWVENTSRILDAVVAHPELFDEPLADEDAAMFRQLLALWHDLASGEATFYWVARAAAADVDRLVRAWATFDSLSDEQLGALGVAWSGPEARPFYEALTAGVLNALAKHDETRQLAETLRGQWPA